MFLFLRSTATRLVKPCTYRGFPGKHSISVEPPRTCGTCWYSAPYSFIGPIYECGQVYRNLTLDAPPEGMREWEAEGERISIRRVRSASPLRKERGVWVFHGNKKLSTAATGKVLRNLREERDRSNRGPRP